MRVSVSNYQATDAAEIAVLLDAIPELPSTSEEGFRAFAALSFNRGARDFRIVRSGTRCGGVLTSTLLPETSPPLRHFRIAIHPDFRREGLGTELLRIVEHQEALPGTILQCNSQGTWSDANTFLKERGFRITRTELLMRRSAFTRTATGLPSGVALRLARRGDDEAWATLHREAYSHLEDFSELTPDDLEAERASPGFTLVIADAALSAAPRGVSPPETE